jgi:serine/threonine-protein kinase
VVRRFRREIEAVSQLSHPNLVMPSTTPETKNCQFLAMEYFEGEDLDRIIASRGPLPIATACDYVRQTALGLQYIHERGLIHRDIKPGNLLITPPPADVPRGQRPEHWGIVRILDLGFVLLQRPGIHDTQGQLTKKGFLLGTVEYTAPEQAENPHDVDIRADLYSLGCTFYEMLTGRVPFPEPNPFKKLHQHQHEEPDAVDLLRPGLPKEVVAVVKKLMAKDATQRYQLPAELAEEMTRILERLDEKAIDWDWRPDAEGPAPTSTPPASQPAMPAANPLIRNLVITTLVALAGMAAVYFLLR